jgi:hypothetical protein
MLSNLSIVYLYIFGRVSRFQVFPELAFSDLFGARLTKSRYFKLTVYRQRNGTRIDGFESPNQFDTCYRSFS